ncbi:MAG: IreB family regulatory phosphoprotein [Filifactor alocis]|nr:IreB family regulatory phosphoprotein [Filifactor alocis]
MSDKKENMDFTMKFEYKREHKYTIKEVLASVWKSLEEKGYNPSNQLVGYLLSGDPGYITSHNNARNMIRMFERDEILEIILEDYMKL